MNMKLLLALPLCLCINAALCAITHAAPGPDRENIVTQPTFEHKVDSCTINHYYVGRSTVQVVAPNQSFRFRIIRNNSKNTRSIFISPLPSMSTFQMLQAGGASWEIVPGDYWYENSYFGSWYCLNEDLSVSSSTVDVIELKKVVQP